MQKDQKKSVIKNFQIHKTDTGSPMVQIAILTKKIKEVTEHLNSHKPDNSARKGLLKMVAQRRKLLIYLKKENSSNYKDLIVKLDLTRDVSRMNKEEELKKRAEKAMQSAASGSTIVVRED